MLRFIPGVAWMVFITYLFLLPGTDLPYETWYEKVYLDKWVHTGFFFILVYLFYIPLRNRKRPNLIKIAIAAVAYGIVIELVQKYGTTDRSFDIIDIVFDALGCIMAYLIGINRLKK